MGKMHKALKKGRAKPRTVAPESDAPQGTTAVPTRQGRRGAGRSIASAHSASASLHAPVRSDDVDSRIVALCDPDSAAAEQFRALAQHVREAVGPKSESGGGRVVTVSSAAAGEGRSISAANLACTLAEDAECKVALIDADLRSPSMHDLLALDHRHGLADYLHGGTMIEMVLQRCRLPNLFVLPAGRVPPDPSAILSGKRLEDLFLRLRRDFDIVIIDTPAVSTSPDAERIAPLTDGAIIAVRVHKTARQVTANAIEVLRRSGAEILGAFVTGLGA